MSIWLAGMGGRGGACRGREERRGASSLRSAWEGVSGRETEGEREAERKGK